MLHRSVLGTNKIFAPITPIVNSASDVNLLLQGVSGVQLDFTPTHILKPDGLVFKDIIGDWDLNSSGGDATINEQAIKSVRESANGWVASVNSKYQFGANNFAFMMIARFSAIASGGYFISNLKGPAADDPYAPGGGPQFGQDKGYGLSLNGDGGLGFGIYGVDGWTNADTANGTINHADNTWRVYCWGYSQTSGIAYLSSAAFNIAFAGAIGSTSNTDAVFGTRCSYYGINQANANHEIALLCVFENTPAQNIYLKRTDFLTNLQALVTP